MDRHPHSLVFTEIRGKCPCRLAAPNATSSYLYTFPRNFVGTVRVSPLRAPARGSSITMVLGEWVESGQPKTRGQQQVEKHTLAAESAGTALETMFVWHGFQFVLVTTDGATTFTGELDAIAGLEIRTDVESVSSLRFGGHGEAGVAASLLNRINSIARGSMVGNVAAYIPTDCKCIHLPRL